ncbi:helix-turn-helix domain-containing GNAT family N-acetyltransferase [Actinocorallia longicatena]|uniref:Helix-turn-helix domain-containing GNAT family N-acetyltransferase n=1 Tax=Actinocorallia longicatena TaxID=111803 RepID=A0ABP6QI94_9ACTN
MNDRIDAVRRFNRRYTELIGVLNEGLLSSPYTLTEVRVLFEIAHAGEAEAAGLRERLRLDAGYLSRILARFESDGLVDRHRSDADARRQLVRLTAEGSAVFADLDARSDDQIRRLLEPLPEGRRDRLVEAMETIERTLDDPSPAAWSLRPLRPGDLGWVASRNGVWYAANRGYDSSYEALCAEIAAGYGRDHDPECENGWIAELDGRPVGAIFCMRAAREGFVAQLRLLLVEPEARGLGIGRALVGTCLDFARNAGYKEMVLWTVDGLPASRHLYVKAGFTLESERPEHKWGKDVLAQWWHLTL